MRAYALLGGPENVWPADIQKRLNKEKGRLFAHRC